GAVLLADELRTAAALRAGDALALRDLADGLGRGHVTVQLPGTALRHANGLVALERGQVLALLPHTGLDLVEILTVSGRSQLRAVFPTQVRPAVVQRHTAVPLEPRAPERGVDVLMHERMQLAPVGPF